MMALRALARPGLAMAMLGVGGGRAGLLACS